jgi:hypothetical protein
MANFNLSRYIFPLKNEVHHQVFCKDHLVSAAEGNNRCLF